jgi:hypothetical protein
VILYDHLTARIFQTSSQGRNSETMLSLDWIIDSMVH